MNDYKALKEMKDAFCKGFYEPANYPKDATSARKFLAERQQWLDSIKGILQQEYHLSKDDPFGAAKDRCEGKRVSRYDEICNWYNAHKFISAVFKPDWEVFMVKFSDLTVLRYLDFSVQHLSIIHLCRDFQQQQPSFNGYDEKFAGQLMKWFERYIRDREKIFSSTLPLGSNTLFAQECQQLCAKPSLLLKKSAYCKIILPMIEPLQNIYRFAETLSTVPSFVAATQLSLLALTSNSDDSFRILSANAEESHDLIRGKRLNDLEKYAEHLPSNSLMLKCKPTGDVCSLLQSFVEGLLDFHYKSKMEMKNGTVTVIRTDVDYPRYLNNRAIEEILRISQNLPLAEIAKYIANKIDSAFGTLKDYFQAMAAYDASTAKSDIESALNMLNTFKRRSSEKSQLVNKNVATLVFEAIVCKTLDVAESAVKTAFRIAEACNPLKTVFNGGTASDILEAAEEAANNIAGLIEAVALSQSVNTLRTKLYAVARGFDENQKFLIMVKKMVDNLPKPGDKVDKEQFEKMVQNFLDQYDAYTTKVTSDQIVEVGAHFAGVVSGACDLIKDPTSVACSAGVKSMVVGKGLCWKTSSAIETMIELFTEILDFQEQLFDAMVRYIRALVSFYRAGDIGKSIESAKKDKDNPHFIEHLKVITAISYSSYTFKTWAIVDDYCNLLEYIEGGKPPRVCKGRDTKTSELVGYKPPTNTGEKAIVGIPMYLPTLKYGNVKIAKGLLDLDGLFKGEEVSFQVPSKEWAVKHGLIAQAFKDYAYFVMRFEIYLPIETTQHVIVSVTADATTGMPLFPDDTKQYAMQPKRAATLTYVHDQGKQQSSCGGTVRDNPYNYCKKELHTLCLRTEDKKADVYPSLYSAWKLKVSGYETLKSLPNATSHMNIQAFFTLVRRNPAGGTWLGGDYNNYFGGRDSDQECCTGNTYWSSEDYACKACPKESISALNGYFCNYKKKFSE